MKKVIKNILYSATFAVFFAMMMYFMRIADEFGIILIVIFLVLLSIIVSIKIPLDEVDE